MARTVYCIPYCALLASGLLLNAIPITAITGGSPPIFVQDLAVLLSGVFFLHRIRFTASSRFIIYLSIMLAIWPVVSTAFLLVGGTNDSQWIVFLCRRFAFAILFLVAFTGGAGQLTARDFFDSSLMIWCGLCICGLIQYFGYIDTDISSLLDEGARSNISILDSSLAQRGYMGMNRGEVGAWGSAMFGYAFSMIFTCKSIRNCYTILYIVTMLLTCSVILFCGSRTGIVSMAVCAAFVYARSLSVMSRSGRVRSILIMGTLAAFIIVAGLQIINLPTLHDRTSLAQSRQDFSLQARAGVQADTLDYIFDHTRALLVGMGDSEDQFFRLVGQSSFDLYHPHSEYLTILWQTGLPGFILYILFLWSIFRRLQSQYLGSVLFSLATAGQAMLVAGLIMAAAVGNIMITSSRLAPFSYFMMFAYGLLISIKRQNLNVHISGYAASSKCH